MKLVKLLIFILLFIGAKFSVLYAYDTEQKTNIKRLPQHIKSELSNCLNIKQEQLADYRKNNQEKFQECLRKIVGDESEKQSKNLSNMLKISKFPSEMQVKIAKCLGVPVKEIDRYMKSRVDHRRLVESCIKRVKTMKNDHFSQSEFPKQRESKSKQAIVQECMAKLDIKGKSIAKLSQKEKSSLGKCARSMRK